jgi:hypothetical protein
MNFFILYNKIMERGTKRKSSGIGVPEDLQYFLQNYKKN